MDREEGCSWVQIDNLHRTRFGGFSADQHHIFWALLAMFSRILEIVSVVFEGKNTYLEDLVSDGRNS